MNLEKINKYCERIFQTIGLVGLAYFGPLLGCQFYSSSIFQEKIKSEKELEMVVDEEAMKLGLEPGRILISYPINGCSATKFGDGYLIEMSDNATRHEVRHELHHVLKDCDKEFGNPLSFAFYYMVIAEPRATLYETFEIKL